MSVWQYISIAFALALMVFSCRKEYLRYNKKNLVLRITATLLAVTTLLGLEFDIPYTHSAKVEDAAVIITSGYNKDSVKNFIKTQSKQVPVYTFDDLVAQGSKVYKKLDVFGYGLTKDELSLLSNTPVVFHPQSVGTGIISAHWKQNLQTGETLHVQGIFNNTKNEPVKLLLIGFNTPFDSAIIPPATRGLFDLVTVPKQLGSAVFNIAASINNTIIESQPVPVDVKQAVPLKVLMLASAPGFENRFLKNWLSDNSFEVVTSNATSKDKYNQSFLNTEKENLSEITKSSLQGFDALVCDAAAFSTLSREEQDAIQLSVEDGMGLIIKADTTLPSSAFYSSNVQVSATGVKPGQQVSIRFAGDGVLHHLGGEHSLTIRSAAGTQPLATDSSSGEIFVTNLTYGAGKIAVTTLNNTYSWMLTGDKSDYYAFWSMMFDKVSKNKSTGPTSNYAPVFPIVNQPVHITFEGPSSSHLVINESPVYLAQQPGLYYRWSGTYWPTGAGWQTSVSQNDTTSFYVFNDSSWKYARAAETIASTQYASGNSTITAENITALQQTPFPKIYFVILFLTCCTFLWVEKKFNG
ncbi:MAG TPA: hypothetical protein VG738_06795 [Chitinophagaceae bacterium]|nr:hypothetical protein [Chitinophagaceae bacterium]